MKNICPECATELTPSIVGYMCHNCGSVVSFDDAKKIKIGAANNKDLKTIQKSAPKDQMNQNSSQLQKNVMPKSPPKPKGLKHSLKRLVVPEISDFPKPIDESHLLEAYYPPNDKKITQTPLGEPSEISPDIKPVDDNNNTNSAMFPTKTIANTVMPSINNDQGLETDQHQSSTQTHRPKTNNNLIITLLIAVVIIVLAIIMLVYIK